MRTIDINCDMGESFGNHLIGNDQAIFPYITSSNIACGFHGGDPLHMHRTIEAAIKHGVQIGAHPGFPDLAGFGRRNMALSPDELKAVIKYQLAAIQGMARSLGTSVKYVKPHGALYNLASGDEKVAKTLIAAIDEIDPGLFIMGLAGSLFQQICLSLNVPFIAEGFADRGYGPDGNLYSRSLPGAVITDPETAASQVMDMVLKNQITTIEGQVIPMEVQSICIHGDNPVAVDILKAIDASLSVTGVMKRRFPWDLK